MLVLDTFKALGFWHMGEAAYDDGLPLNQLVYPTEAKLMNDGISKNCTLDTGESPPARDQCNLVFKGVIQAANEKVA